MSVITNTSKQIRNIGTVTLQPGSNIVPTNLWESIQKKYAVQSLIDGNIIKIQPPAKDQKSDIISDLSEKEAVKVVQECENIKQLETYAIHDSRVTIQTAIEQQKKFLSQTFEERQEQKKRRRKGR